MFSPIELGSQAVVEVCLENEHVPTDSDPLNEIVGAWIYPGEKALMEDVLAAEASMSAPTFHRIFKKITGSSPLQHIKAIRLQRARDLLVIEKQAVGQVAQQVGYDSAAHFSREFKKYFGVSPKHARAWG